MTNFGYYSTHEFHSNEDIRSTISDRTFSALHFNIRSLSANFDDFYHMLCDMKYSFSVIALSETKIKAGIDPFLNTNLPGYSFLSQPSMSNAGGVGFYIKDNLSYIKRDDFCTSNPEFESIWIEIEVPHQHNIVCGLIYRHPDQNITKAADFLYKATEKVNKEGKFCLLMGDFNINLLNYDSHSETEDFVNTLGSYAFHPQILKPTRITYHSATLIDNIFFNSLEHYAISGNIVCGITDHLPNFLIITKLSNPPKNFKMYKRDYSGLDNEMLISEVSKVNWEEVLASESGVLDVNTIFQNFYLCISNLVNKHAPLRKLTRKEIKSLSKPWVTPGIQTSIRLKEKFYKRFLETRNIYFLTKYKFYRNKITELLKASKKNYYHNYFIANSKNIKKTWAGIKELITLKPNGFSSPSKIVVGNNVITDSKAIASAFNDHFSQIGSKLAEDIPQVDIDPLDFLGPSLANSFMLFPASAAEIEEIISSLNSSKVSGPFSIPVCLLKLLKTCISFPLEFIFNISFSSGCVPDQFKLANVIPVHKKDSVTCMNNYRPISLLSIFNKILEKLVYNRLITFIEKYNVLYDKQFGFRRNHSTLHATLLITDKIQRAIEDGLFSCGIFLDFSKAFDTVDHNILLKKLSHYGIRGIANDWFASYLSNRRQYVTIGSIKSEDTLITHGVPQGSVLGPLLFLLYINDFSKCSNVFDFHIFADDTNLFYSNSNLAELESIVNYNLKMVSDWLTANKVSLNIDKTNFIIFHPPQKVKGHLVKLTIDKREIAQEKFIKYLGLIIDSHLSWKYHILHISKKIKRCIGILSKIRYSVTDVVLVQLYYSLIYPFLTYSLITWGTTYQTTLLPLITLQKRAVRIITFSEYNCHSSPLFRKLKLLKVSDLLYLYCALFMYDYYSNRLPLIFNDFFMSINKVHQYQTRLASKISYYLPKARTNYGKFNIRFSGVKVWNSIEDSLKSKSRTCFKISIKESLISNY